MKVHIAETEYGGHASRLAARAIEEGMEGVVTAGGDGTVNEVATALRSSQTALGILPYGSGNGLARHILGSIDVDHALDVIALGNTSPCDYGTANGRPFFCTFGMGFDANVSREFANMPNRGLASYVRSAIGEYVRFRPSVYRIRTHSHNIEVKAFIVAVCNASQYGNNAFIAPQASIRDGLLDIMIIHAGNPLSRAIAGMELFTGRLNRNVLIDSLRVREATITHVPGPAHIDGEPINSPQTVEVMCHPGDLRIYTDAAKAPFKPFLSPIESTSKDSVFLVKENARQILKMLSDRLKSS